MKDNFFTSMFGEGGRISSKRVIAFMYACFSIWAGVYIVTHYQQWALTVFGYTLIFLGLLLGLYTLPQVVSLIKGNGQVSGTTNASNDGDPTGGLNGPGDTPPPPPPPKP